MWIPGIDSRTPASPTYIWQVDMNMNLSDAIDLRLGLLGLPGVQAKASSEDSELILSLIHI